MNGRENKASSGQLKITLRQKRKSWNLANLTKTLNFSKIKRTCQKLKEIDRSRAIPVRIETKRNEIYPQSRRKETKRRKRKRNHERILKT